MRKINPKSMQLAAKYSENNCCHNTNEERTYRCMVGLFGGSPWFKYGVVGVDGGKPGVMGLVPPMLLSVSLCQALSSRLW